MLRLKEIVENVRFLRGQPSQAAGRDEGLLREQRDPLCVFWIRECISGQLRWNSTHPVVDIQGCAILPGARHGGDYTYEAGGGHVTAGHNSCMTSI